MSPILGCGSNGFGEQAAQDNTALFRQLLSQNFSGLSVDLLSNLMYTILGIGLYRVRSMARRPWWNNSSIIQ